MLPLLFFVLIDTTPVWQLNNGDSARIMQEVGSSQNRRKFPVENPLLSIGFRGACLAYTGLSYYNIYPDGKSRMEKRAIIRDIRAKKKSNIRSPFALLSRKRKRELIKLVRKSN